MMRVGVGLEDVLALNVNSHERAFDGRVEHVRNTQARLPVERDAPKVLVDRTGGLIGDVPIARELMWEGTHVAGPLHIVLAAQRIDPDAATAKVSSREGEIGDREHRGRALAVLGNAEPIIDRRIAAGGIEPRRLADEIGRNAGDLFDRFRAVALLRDKFRPILEFRRIAAFPHESLVDQTFGDNHMGKRGHDRDIGARLQGKVIVGLGMRCPNKVDTAGVENNKLGALAQSFFHPRSKDRMRIGRIRPDNHHHIGFIDRIEVLGSCRRAESCPKAIAGR
jgi:hypothetical protein